ncbi:MAG TPA: enoyl-CoA hydratase-related protein [Gaiellaceae bacterium]|nr:enoyl-CoA hydratase-related protein [Gaiellaceae bacterium]
MKQTHELVKVEVEHPLALVTIDRPETLNAIDETTLRKLGGAIDAIETDDEIRVVIVTGAGEKAFVAGGDIAAMQRMSVREGERFARLGHEVLLRIERARAVVIAAINGHALGGGTELALACDIRVASERATLGLPETTIGLFPGWGGTQRLLRTVGIGRAKDLVLTGRRIKADEAFRIGLVEYVVPHDELLDRARELAGQIVANGPIAVAQAKKALNQGAQTSLDQGLAIELEAWLVNFGTSDRGEGLLAFLEKRPAEFTGR